MAAVASPPDEISRVFVLELKGCGCVSSEEVHEAADKPRCTTNVVRRNINNASRRHVSRYKLQSLLQSGIMLHRMVYTGDPYVSSDFSPILSLVLLSGI